MYSVSHLQVKFLKIAAAKGYNPYRWVRYVTHSNSFVCRTWPLSITYYISKISSHQRRVPDDDALLPRLRLYLIPIFERGIQLRILLEVKQPFLSELSQHLEHLVSYCFLIFHFFVILSERLVYNSLKLLEGRYRRIQLPRHIVLEPHAHGSIVDRIVRCVFFTVSVLRSILFRGSSPCKARRSTICTSLLHEIASWELVLRVEGSS